MNRAHTEIFSCCKGLQNSVIIRFVCFVLFFFFACGPDEINNSPILEGFSFLGQDYSNCYLLYFSVKFKDSDGDLGFGKVIPVVNGEIIDDQGVDAQKVFLESSVEKEANEGTLFFRLDFTGSKSDFKENRVIELGIMAKDAANHWSNIPRIVLRIKNR